MQFIKNLKDGQQIQEIYLCSRITPGTTKTGKPYLSVVLMDKTGEVDSKIWDPDSPGIGDFDEGDFVRIKGEVRLYQGNKQLSLAYLQKAGVGEYNEADYFPKSERDEQQMYDELVHLIDSLKGECYKVLLRRIFIEDKSFSKRFCSHTAAKSVHHSFVGGLMEHTLSVANLCDFYSKNYPIIDRDLIITAALLHDIGKTKELSSFPTNDYTNEGQLFGHIIIGVMMIKEHLDAIGDFPNNKAEELIHCILSHHGMLEYGSPKKPELIEALALSYADNTDAKIETMKEALEKTEPNDYEWQGYNRFLESTIRRTTPAVKE